MFKWKPQMQKFVVMSEMEDVIKPTFSQGNEEIKEMIVRPYELCGSDSKWIIQIQSRRL